MLKHLCVFIFANFIIANETHEIRSSYLQHKLELNEFLCKDYIFKRKSESPIQCGLFCQSNKLCRNVFFDINSYMCTGCEQKSVGKQYEPATEQTLSYEVHRFHPVTSTALVAKSSTSDPATLSPSGKTQFSTNAVSLTTPDSVKTIDFFTSTSTGLSTTSDIFTTTGVTITTDSFKSYDLLTSTGTALSTTSDLSTTNGFTATTDAATITDYLPISTKFTDQQMKMITSAENVDENQGVSRGTYKYMLLQNVDFHNAAVQCSNFKVTQDGHLAWIESDAENDLLSHMLLSTTKNYSSTDELAFIGVKVDSKNILSLVPSGQLQAEVYKRSTKYPNYGKENCVAIQSTGLWLATSCYENITAICEL